MSWKNELKEICETSWYKQLMNRVNHLYETKTIYPPKKDLFKAFTLTPYENVKVVILGQDPYHQPNQANGLAFSVSKEVSVPPSLKNIYKELHHDLTIPPKPHGDLTNWAKQGVLLLNTILTVEKNTPSSHKNIGWEQFSDEVIKKLSNHPKPVVFMLFGNHAKSKSHLIDSDKHLIIKTSHPSPLGAYHSFFGSKPFSKANAFLAKHNRDVIDYRL